MPDDSHLDERYFLDSHVYNCPFCNRRNVEYTVTGYYSFDWTDSKRCHVYFVCCHSCNKESMHLSYTNITLTKWGYVDNQLRRQFSFGSQTPDDLFFHSVPSSFFVLDRRIPRVLRELLTEAEGSLKGNFLTGASACARKIVYELAVLSEATGNNYEERIRSLKGKHPEVEGTYFDTLLTVQQVTSSKVHENAYDKWEARHVRLLLASLRRIFHEVYVLPALRADRREEIEALKNEVLGKKASKSAEGEDTPQD